jgi:hypothetical protein
MKIAVYQIGHHPSRNKALVHIPKNVAALRVRRLEAEWAGRQSIILLKVNRPSHTARPMTPLVCKPYIPEHMPPVDLPGIKFVPPKRKIHAFAYGPVSVADAR